MRVRAKQWIPSPPQRVIGPAAYYPLSDWGCHEGATPFTHCRWGFYFLVDTSLPRGLLKKRETR